MTTSINIESADQAAITAMIGHHAHLRSDLENRVAALRETVAANQPHVQAQARVVEFLKGDILPHAIAEEDTIYRAANEVSRIQPLISGMLLEHRELERRARALELSSTGSEALVSAAGFAAIFAVHVAKENDVLLPALLESPTASVANLLREMEARLAEVSARGNSTGSTPSEILDVRTLAHGARHEIIFGRLHALRPGEILVIVNDHDPKPLRYQLDAAWPDSFGWEYLEEGPHEFRIAITKLQ